MWTKFLKERSSSFYIMYYVLVYYPKFDGKTEEDIKVFRRKYDPFVDSWKPHIPFIFPVACSEARAPSTCLQSINPQSLGRQRQKNVGNRSFCGLAFVYLTMSASTKLLANAKYEPSNVSR